MKKYLFYLLLGLAFALFHAPVQADNLAPPLQVDCIVDMEADVEMFNFSETVAVTNPMWLAEEKEVPVIRAGEFFALNVELEYPYITDYTNRERSHSLINIKTAYRMQLDKFTHYTVLGYSLWN